MGKEKLIFLTHNPFQFINTNKGFADEHALQMLARDLYKLMFSVGIGLIALSIIVLFIRWALYRNKEGAMNRRNVIVGPMLLKLMLVAAISAFPYLLTLVMEIVNSVAKAAVS